MKLIKKIVVQKESCRFSVPFEGKCFDVVSQGKSVHVGDLLFRKKYKRVLEVYNLETELGIKAQNATEYIARLDGEYVTKGEILAERIVSGGLSVRKVLAVHDGIISLEKISKGIVEILSEHVEEDVLSNISGKVVEVDFNKGIVLEGNGLLIPFAFPSQESQIAGTIECLGDANSIHSIKDLKGDYSGKIVFAGRFAYANLLLEIAKRGAKAILVYSMEYMELDELPFPIFVVGGFGNIHYDFRYAKLFNDLDGSFATIEGDSMTVADSGQYLFEKNTKIIQSSVQINDLVRVEDVDNFGRVGRVIDGSNEDGYFTILLAGGDRLLVSEEMLSIVTF